MTAIVLGVVYARVRCDHCQQVDVCRDTPRLGWICFFCVVCTPMWLNATPRQRNGLCASYRRAEIALDADVPVERCFAAADMNWYRTLV
jgi:hypothetical protein